MRLFKSIIRPIVMPLASPFLLLRELAAKRTNSTKNIINDVNERKKIRDDQEFALQMMNNRQAFLAAWGINDNYVEINNVKRGLMFEVISFTIISTFPVIGLITDLSAFMYWVAALTITPFCLFFASTRLWRYECVVDGRLTPYRNWMFGGKT